jgi:hypothetical protein
MNKTIKEAEFKLEALPQSYFLNYFESDFLPKIKKIYKELAKKCNEPVDSLLLAEFQNELKKIIG